jgi:hypothetical protein
MATQSPFYLVGHPMMDTSGRIFTEPIVGGTNARRFMPHFCVQASLGGNANVWYVFRCLVAPVATLKAEILRVANATSGNARLNISWAAGAMGTNFDTISLSAEGVQTLSWAAGNDYDILQTLITLDAATAPTAGQLLFLQAGFETASWTLAQKSYWAINLIDE